MVGGGTEPVRHRRPTWWCDRDRDDDRAHRGSSGCRVAVGGNTTQRSVGVGPAWPSRQLEPAYATKPPKGPRRRAKGWCEGISAIAAHNPANSCIGESPVIYQGAFRRRYQYQPDPGTSLGHLLPAAYRGPVMHPASFVRPSSNTSRKRPGTVRMRKPCPGGQSDFHAALPGANA